MRTLAQIIAAGLIAILVGVIVALGMLWLAGLL